MFAESSCRVDWWRLGRNLHASDAPRSCAMDWRKGVDLFPILVKHLFSQPCSRRVHVVWIGGDWEGIYTLQMRHDLSRLGLEDRVHITGFKANPLEYMATLDAFALTSREDPFPRGKGEGIQ